MILQQFYLIRFVSNDYFGGSALLPKINGFRFYFVSTNSDSNQQKENRKMEQHKCELNQVVWLRCKFVQGCTFGGRNKIQPNL